MKKRLYPALVILLLAPASLVHAQAAPAAIRPLTLWVGAGFSNLQPDFGTTRVSGVSVYSDLNWSQSWGAEIEARWLRSGASENERFSNYLGGVRYRLPVSHRVVPYGKLLLGSGAFTFPDGIGHGSYLAYVPGVGVDLKVTDRWKIRVDYEYQRWPSAPNLPTYSNHGLSPSGFTVGVSWRIPD